MFDLSCFILFDSLFACFVQVCHTPFVLWDAWSILVMEEQSSYKGSATIARKYALLINRSRMLHEQTPKSEFPRIRESGATNINLWIDGSIYPHHSSSKKRQSFRSVSDLLKFVGEDKKRLLGYVESLFA